MNLITQLLSTALNELFQRGELPLPPEEMDSFEAECEIGGYGVSSPLMPFYIAKLCGWSIFIWEREGNLEAYFAMEQDRAATSKLKD